MEREKGREDVARRSSYYFDTNKFEAPILKDLTGR
jgi:hypothetical protein